MGNAHFQAPPTHAQAVGVEVSKMVASIPSIIGASFILQHVLRRRRRGPFSRIMLGMSLMDLIYACVSACSSTIAPKEVNWLLNFAKGNWATCEAFGFLGLGSSLSSIVYNCMLTLHYLLTIRYGWSERKMKRIELWLHLVPLVIGWGIATPALPLNFYNPNATGCSLTAYPFGCKRRGNCERGEEALRYRLYFFFGLMWVVFSLLVVAMALIYCSISAVIPEPSPLQNNVEQLRERGEHVPTRRQGPRTLHRLRQEFAIQALLYCVAFAMTWLFGTVGIILIEWTKAPVYMPIVFLNAILSSLQGCWNAVIYFRPRYLRYRRRQNLERGRQGGDSPLPSHPRGVIQSIVKALSVPEEEENDNVEEDEVEEEEGEGSLELSGHLFSS